jgi:hypothetical protein
MDSLPTWDDIECAARDSPVLHTGVTLVHAGKITREEALIVMTLALSKALKDSIAREIGRLSAVQR